MALLTHFFVWYLLIRILMNQGKILLNDAQPSHVARSISLSPQSKEQSSEQRLSNIVNQGKILIHYSYTELGTLT